MNIVEKKFVNKAVLNTESLVLYTGDDAIDFVIECRKEHIGILGIDGFFIIHQDPSDQNLSTIKPSLKDSIDFTLEINREISDVYEYSINFLRSRKQDVYFEIVCDEGLS